MRRLLQKKHRSAAKRRWRHALNLAGSTVFDMADYIQSGDFFSEDSSNISDCSASTDSESVDLSEEEFEERIITGRAVHVSVA